MTDHNDTLSPNDTSIDLTNCDREPIHILGRVQSFGALLAVSRDWIVSHASRNLSEFVGMRANDAIGLPVIDILSKEAVHDLRKLQQLLISPESVERIFGVRLLETDELFDVALHLSGQSIIIEIERHSPSERADYTSYVRPMIERIRAAESTQKLCDIAARQLRGLIGFDRVMIYKFDKRGSGTVTAESVSGERELFKGLRYPASDIPKQARALYKRSLLRIIADVSDKGVEIVPELNSEGQPLDLSMSVTRAVSPIHLEYLKNMGVGASMSISILIRGELWGLLACHNDTPKTLSYGVRSAAELFGQLFAFVLDQHERDEERSDREQAQLLHNRVMSKLAEGGSISDNLEAVLNSIKTVIPFDGAIGWIEGRFTAVGQTLHREEFLELVQFLNTKVEGRVFETDSLVKSYPKAEAFAGRISGIMVLPVSRTSRDYIVLCRQELINVVKWAGNPEKPVTVGKLGLRLTPRKSFEAWQETIKNTCSPWTIGERRAAEALRITLLEVVVRLSDASLSERAKAQESQEILIAELNHRVRNILNLIKGLINQSKDDAASVAEFTNIVGGRIHALARAHDQITRENWSPASAQELIETEAKAYLDEKKDRILISGTDALLSPTAFTTLSLVVHELLTNSMKYGALCVSQGFVEVVMKQNNDGAFEINWREQGGPPIQTPPVRKGFGTTIIERSIPFELKGTANVKYKSTGLEARLVIPSAFVANFRNSNYEAVETVSTSTLEIELNGNVLVVEDNFIIAMDAEDILMKLGATSITMASDIGSALDAIARTKFTFALLDVNLGAETSEPIAKTLKDQGIPFAFATGYGDATEITSRFKNAIVVQKPYSRESILYALTETIA